MKTDAINSTYFDKILVITGILLVLSFMIPNNALYACLLSAPDDWNTDGFTAFWNYDFNTSDMLFITWPLIAGVFAILAGVCRIRNGRFMVLSILGLMGILTMFSNVEFSSRGINCWLLGRTEVQSQELLAIFAQFGIWTSLLAGAISVIHAPSNRFALTIAAISGVLYIIFSFVQLNSNSEGIIVLYPDYFTRIFAETGGLLLSKNLDIMNGSARGIGIVIYMFSIILTSTACIYGFFTTKRRRLMAVIAVISITAGTVVSHAVPFYAGLYLTGELIYGISYIKMALWFYGLGFLCVIGATERMLSSHAETRSGTLPIL